MPGIEGSGWIGFVTGATVPAAIQRRLSTVLRQALAEPDVRAHRASQYMEPVGDTAEQFRQYTEQERQRWAPLIEPLGLTASN